MMQQEKTIFHIHAPDPAKYGLWYLHWQSLLSGDHDHHDDRIPIQPSHDAFIKVRRMSSSSG